MSELSANLGIPLPGATIYSKRLLDIQAVREALIELDVYVSYIRDSLPQTDITGNAGTATALQTPRKINGVDFDGSADITFPTYDASALHWSDANRANGFLQLDGSGLVSPTLLPSYVDSVQEFANYNALPAIGEASKIYLTLDNAKIYRWASTVYVDITSAGVQKINGQTGVIILGKSDVGLGNVDNTGDLAKPVSLATQAAIVASENYSITTAANDATAKANNAKSASAPISHVGSTGVAHGQATTFEAGFMSATDKSKLDAITGTNTGDQTDVTGNAGTATALETARTINGVAFDGTKNITINAVDTTARVPMTAMGAANGVATLDVNGLIPTNQLPSFVDEIVQAATLADFPATGLTTKMYVAADTGRVYRWTGSIYVYIPGGGGTADSATRLYTTRSITASGDANWTVNFDGTGNVTSQLTLADTAIVAGEWQVATYDSKGRAIAGRKLQIPDIPNIPGSKIATDISVNTSGNAATADAAARLQEPRTIGMMGDGSWTVTFDGTENLFSTLNLIDTGVVAGEWAVATYDSKGRAIAGRTLVADDIPSLDASKLTTGTLSVPTSANAGTATKLQVARTINDVPFDGGGNITINAIDITARIAVSQMGVANGVATLDGNGLIPTSQLPSYVDDIIEGATSAAFPTTGLHGKIYVALDTGFVYRWAGTSYVYIPGGGGTADTAIKLYTPRTIAITGDGTWSTSFDGSGNVTGELTLANSGIAAGEWAVATYDSKGRATSGRVLTDSDIPALPGSKITSDITVNTSGNAGSSTKLANARTVSVTGDATWSITFDGTSNVTSALTLADSGITPDSYAVTTFDSKGRATSGRSLIVADIPDLPGTKVTSDISVNTSGNAATATKLLTARTINGVNFDGTGNISITATDSVPRLAASLLGAANGVASLDSNGLIPTSQLPSYVDDIIEGATLSAFPATGLHGKLYVALDTGFVYRWTGSAYVYIPGGGGTADSAVKLYTARTIAISGDATGSATFDGTANANIAITLKASSSVAAGSMSASDKAKLDGIDVGAKAAPVVLATLPSTMAANSLYFIKNGTSVDTYLSDATGATATKVSTGGGGSNSIDSFLLMGASNG